MQPRHRRGLPEGRRKLRGDGAKYRGRTSRLLQRFRQGPISGERREGLATSVRRDGAVRTEHTTAFEGFENYGGSYGQTRLRHRWTTRTGGEHPLLQLRTSKDSFYPAFFRNSDVWKAFLCLV